VRLQLASTSQQLRNVCEEVFRDIPDQTWTVETLNSPPPCTSADLYLWDVDQTAVPFESIPANDTWRHFFLVDRTHLQQCRELIPFESAHILLKPVTRAALSAFLTDACKRCVIGATTSGDALIESLRADRDELLQCLMQANLKLQEYDHDRTNFLARAIHDFRAPLTAVTGYCGLLLGEDVGMLSEEQREVVDRMHHSAKKLSRMASAMFQLSIAPHVEAHIDLQSAEIRDCIDHALNEILPAAGEKRITIAADIAQPPRPLYFEAAKIEQVLLNLLDNACKFVPRGGTVDIKGYPYRCKDWLSMDHDGDAVQALKHAAAPAPNSYRIDIRDSGPGIPAAHLTTVFEEYTSYGGGVDRSGGGLGLAICRMIVNQHKGQIWAESSKDGGVFSFVLPFHLGHARFNHESTRAVHAGAL
jgi:signal transduction histidine kinase